MVVIEKNEETAHLWDVEENIGFKKMYGYKINCLIPGKLIKVSLLLAILNDYIDIIKKGVYEVNPKSPHRDLLYYTPYELQELPLNSGFHGLNKPKNIEYSKERGLFKLDDEYRAGWRLIMLELRDKDGNFIEWESLRDTLLHELAHTMCNHCTYRTDGNHAKDFDEAEKRIRDYALNSNNPHLKVFEKDIKEILET